MSEEKELTLKEIKEQRKALLIKERELKATQDENKDERIKLTKQVKADKIIFETSRKAYSENTKKFNAIHLGKSALKNLDDFKTISADLMLSMESASETLTTYLESLQKLKDLA